MRFFPQGWRRARRCRAYRLYAEKMPPRPTRISTLTHFRGIDEPIRITRSTARRSTVAARRREGVFELLIPASMSAREEERWVRTMYQKYGLRHKKSLQESDRELHDRALELARRYLPHGYTPASVRWVSNQKSRWGSCTSAERSIRLSDELRGMPQYVIDSVLIHELAHLVYPDHGPKFRTLERSFERHTEARAFLDGVSFQKNRGADP